MTSEHGLAVAANSDIEVAPPSKAGPHGRWLMRAGVALFLLSLVNCWVEALAVTKPQTAGLATGFGG